MTADFNGDGTSDEARILQNADRQIAYVVAVIKSPAKIDTYVLSQVDISSVGNTGIQTAKPRPDLTSQSSSGIAVVDLTTGKGEAMYFDGAEFDVRVSIEGSTPSSAA